jgi:hypothetical protein
LDLTISEKKDNFTNKKKSLVNNING